jgi:hypothetical protein
MLLQRPDARCRLVVDEVVVREQSAMLTGWCCQLRMSSESVES